MKSEFTSWNIILYYKYNGLLLTLFNQLWHRLRLWPTNQQVNSYHHRMISLLSSSSATNQSQPWLGNDTALIDCDSVVTSDKILTKKWEEFVYRDAPEYKKRNFVPFGLLMNSSAAGDLIYSGHHAVKSSCVAPAAWVTSTKSTTKHSIKKKTHEKILAELKFRSFECLCILAQAIRLTSSHTWWTKKELNNMNAISIIDRYRVFIKYCVFSKDFRKFQTLVFLCFRLVSVCVHTTGR